MEWKEELCMVDVSMAEWKTYEEWMNNSKSWIWGCDLGQMNAGGRANEREQELGNGMWMWQWLSECENGWVNVKMVCECDNSWVNVKIAEWMWKWLSEWQRESDRMKARVGNVDVSTV